MLFVLLSMSALFLGTASAETVKWPEGAGQKLVKSNCLICHSSEIIMGQRLSMKSWAKEVNKMDGWGSPIKESDKKSLVEYLSKNFSPETPLPSPTVERFEL